MDKCFHCGATSPGNDDVWRLYRGLRLCEKCIQGVRESDAATSAVIRPPPAVDIVDRLNTDFSVDAAYAAIGEIQRLRGLGRRAAQRLIEEIGADGPEYFEETVERAAERLSVYRRALRLVIAAADGCSWGEDQLASFAEDALQGDASRFDEWEEKLGCDGQVLGMDRKED